MFSQLLALVLAFLLHRSVDVAEPMPVRVVEPAAVVVDVEPAPAPQLVDVDEHQAVDVDEHTPATDSPMCVPELPEHVPAFPDCWWNPDDGPPPA